MSRIRTATIHVYPLFQAKGYECRAFYKNKCLKSMQSLDKAEALKGVSAWVKMQGFTHAKIQEENLWQKVLCHKVKL